MNNQCLFLSAFSSYIENAHSEASAVDLEFEIFDQFVFLFGGLAFHFVEVLSRFKMSNFDVCIMKFLLSDCVSGIDRVEKNQELICETLFFICEFFSESLF